LPYGSWVTVNLTAKSAIDNCRAGRAAKGASPTISTKKEKPTIGSVFSFLYDTANMVGLEGGSRFTGVKRFALRKLGNGTMEKKIKQCAENLN
jgi:hypothetical protein